MHSGCKSWLMLVQPSSHRVAMEADTCAKVGEGSAGTTQPTCWENVVAEYADVFNRLVCLQKGIPYIVPKWNLALSHRISNNIAYLLLNLWKSCNSWTSILKRSGLGPHACHTETPLCLYARKQGSSV